MTAVDAIASFQSCSFAVDRCTSRDNIFFLTPDTPTFRLAQFPMEFRTEIRVLQDLQTGELFQIVVSSPPIWAYRNYPQWHRRSEYQSSCSVSFSVSSLLFRSASFTVLFRPPSVDTSTTPSPTLCCHICHLDTRRIFTFWDLCFWVIVLWCFVNGIAGSLPILLRLVILLDGTFCSLFEFSLIWRC